MEKFLHKEAAMQVYAEMADHAMKTGLLIPPVGAIYPSCTVQDAYDIQFANSAKRLADGWQIIGYKVGVITAAAQKKMQIEQPAFGLLYDNMVYQNGTHLTYGELHNPVLEVEIALTISADIKRPIHTYKEILERISCAQLAFEIPSNRLLTPPPDAAALIADGTASRCVVLSNQTVSGEKIMELADEKISLYKNERLIETADMSNVMGDPIRPVIWLANLLLANGKHLQAGNIVMTGSATQAITFCENDALCARSALLGCVSAFF